MSILEKAMATKKTRKAAIDLTAARLKSTNTVKEFCALNNICRATFDNWQQRGIGPKVMRVGRRVIISQEAQAEWRKSLESNAVIAQAA
jgi:hypothetical protein